MHVMPSVILYINGTSELGGTDTDLFLTVRTLDRSQFTPIVVLPHRGPFDDAYAALGVEVIHLDLPVMKRSGGAARSMARLIPSIAELRALVRARKVDLVYTNSLVVLTGGIAARLSGIPTIWHSGELFDRPRLVGQALYALTGALATRIIVSSDAVRERFPAFAKPKVHVLRNGVDLERFASADGGPAREALGIPRNVPLVGFVGRFTPWKGADHFVRIAAAVRQEVPEAHFLVVGARLEGYPEYLGEVRALADQLGLSEHVTFAEDRLDVPELMAAMDVFVHSSLRPEPFGIVILEAMAAGRPVVAVNAGGVPEIVSRPDVGTLVPLGDVAASAAAVVRFLTDPNHARTVGQAAQAHVSEHFDSRAVTRRAERIYHEALGSAPVRA
jgi:glycosyltransferase involved in cell wall biosynthesis